MRMESSWILGSPLPYYRPLSKDVSVLRGLYLKACSHQWSVLVAAAVVFGCVLLCFLCSVCGAGKRSDEADTIGVVHMTVCSILMLVAMVLLWLILIWTRA